MSVETPSEPTALVELFKALANESRLRLIGLLAEQPHTVEELAEALALSASTVSHHLSKLKEVDLVDCTRDQYYSVYRFKPERLHEVARVLSAPQPVAVARPDAESEAERYRAEVMKNFLVDGRLVKIPAQRKKREVVLDFLAEQFDRDRPYSEKEVNAVIGEFHDDYCTLRRELIMGGRWMTREAGTYRRS